MNRTSEEKLIEMNKSLIADNNYLRERIGKMETVFGYYDASDCTFALPGFYHNEAELVARGVIFPLYYHV